VVRSFTSNGLSWFLSSVDEITAAACGPLQSVHVCILHKTVLETNSETITTKDRQSMRSFVHVHTMDNITVVDLAAEAVLQGPYPDLCWCCVGGS